MTPNDRATLKVAEKILTRHASRSDQVLTSAKNSVTLFRLALEHETREHFEVAFLDNRHCLIAKERLFSGTIDGASVHPRVIAQRGLELNASAVVLAHNHPSGVATPSDADRGITQKIKNALDLFEIRTLDHIIIGKGEHASLAEMGIL